MRWQLASPVVDAKLPLSERRERNGKRETDSRVLIHANDPLDRRPVRPVGGRDFEHELPRGTLICDLHSHRKIATESASRPPRVRANHEVIPDRRPLLAGCESHLRRGQYQGHNDEDPQEHGAGRTKGGRINLPRPTRRDPPAKNAHQPFSRPRRNNARVNLMSDVGPVGVSRSVGRPDATAFTDHSNSRRRETNLRPRLRH